MTNIRSLGPRCVRESKQMRRRRRCRRLGGRPHTRVMLTTGNNGNTHSSWRENEDEVGCLPALDGQSHTCARQHVTLFVYLERTTSTWWEVSVSLIRRHFSQLRGSPDAGESITSDEKFCTANRNKWRNIWEERESMTKLCACTCGACVLVFRSVWARVRTRDTNGHVSHDKGALCGPLSCCRR